MSVESIQILLAASSNKALKGKLLNSLNAFNFKTNKSKSAYQAEQVVFVNELLSQFKSDEPFEELTTSVNIKLIEAAKWLNSINRSVFDFLRDDNIKLKVIVTAWIDQDQFDLELPSDFLLACGQQGLPILVVTND